MRRNPRNRFRGLSLGAMLMALVLVGVACGDDDDSGGSDSGGGADLGSLTMGSKDFVGAQILGQVYGQALERFGYDVSYQENIGATELIFPLLEDGEIDLYPEYQGTFLFYKEGEPTGDTDETYGLLQDELEGTGIIATEPAPAVDVNGFYMMQDQADELGVETLSDLEGISQDLVLGGPPECEERQPCLLGLQDVYGLEFASVEKLDVGGPITAQNLVDGVIDIGVLFTGSSVIPDGAVLLEDDKQLQPADNPVVLVNEDVDDDALNDLLNEVSAKITTEAYNEMNRQVTEDQVDPDEVATQFLDDNGLS